MRGALLAVVGLLLAMPSVNAQPTPVAWVVRTHEIIDADTEHTGDILIMDGGTLEVRATLTINKPSPYEPKIHVQAGGTFILNGTPERPARLQSALATADPLPPFTSFFYKVKVDAGGQWRGLHCEASGTGYHPFQTMPGGNRPVEVEGEISLEDCALHDGIYMWILGGKATLRNVTAWDNGQTLTGRNADILIEGFHSDESSIGLGRMRSAILRDLEFKSDEPASFFLLALAGNDGSGAVDAGASFYISNLTVDVPVGLVSSVLSANHADIHLDGAFIRGVGTALDLSATRLDARHLDIVGAPLRENDAPAPIHISDSNLVGFLEWDTNTTLWLTNVAFDYRVRHDSAAGFRWESRYAVRVVTEKGYPVVGVPITMDAEQKGVAVVSGVTDAQGRFEVVLPRGRLEGEGPLPNVDRIISWRTHVQGVSQILVVPERGGEGVLVVPDSAIPTDSPTAPAPLPLPLLALALAALARRRA